MNDKYDFLSFFLATAVFSIAWYGLGFAIVSKNAEQVVWYSLVIILMSVLYVIVRKWKNEDTKFDKYIKYQKRTRG